MPITWEFMTELLQGFGEHTSRSEYLRIYLSARVVKRIRPVAKVPWLISIWSPLCIHAIPAELWTKYVAYLSRNAVPSQSLLFMERTALRVTLDKKRRWQMTKEFIGRLQIGERLVVVACEAWLELWDQGEFEKQH
jgi:DNA-binding transcriptional regulator/RsmH inhibitor MraZ